MVRRRGGTNPTKKSAETRLSTGNDCIPPSGVQELLGQASNMGRTQASSRTTLIDVRPSTRASLLWPHCAAMILRFADTDAGMRQFNDERADV
jgi:hypothetical protein